MPSMSKLTSKQSFTDLQNWLQEAKQNVPSECIFTLVGTKTDLTRQVSYSEAVVFQKSHKIDIFIETSSKTGYNVQAAFEESAKELIS